MAALHRNCERRELGRSRLAEVTNRNAEDCRALRNRIVALAIYPVVRSLEAKDVRPATDLLAAGVMETHRNAGIHPVVLPDNDIRRLDARLDGQDGPVRLEVHLPAFVVPGFKRARLARIKDNLSTRSKRHGAHCK